MNQYELESLWVNSALSVIYRFGDSVRITSGEQIGEMGRVVALLAVEPVPTYVLEFPDGTSTVAVEPDLEDAL